MLDVNSGCVHIVDELVYELSPIVEKELKRSGVKSGIVISDQVKEGDQLIVVGQSKLVDGSKLEVIK